MPRLSLLLLPLLLLATTLSAQVVHVIAPDGGERFRVGSTTTLRWEGVAATDTVEIEYSIDGGLNWLPITSQGTGLQHNWRVPNTPSTSCLLRVSTRTVTTDSVLYLRSAPNASTFPESIHYAEFSPDGSRVVGGGVSGNLYIWNAATGALISTIPVESGTFPSNPGITRISSARYSPDGTLIATVSPIDAQTGATVRIFDATTGTKLREWQKIDPAPNSNSSQCAFSPDGTRLVVTGLNGGNIYNVSTGADLVRLKGYTINAQINDSTFFTAVASMVGCDWLPDGSAVIGGVLTSSDAPYNLLLSDATTGDTIRSYKVPSTGTPQAIHLDPTATQVVASFSDSIVYLVNIGGGIAGTIPAYAGFLSDALYNHSGTAIGTAGSDDATSPNWRLKLFTPAGALVRTVGAIPNGMQNLDFSPNDARILVSCIDGARIFQAPTTLPGSSDISDSLWTIYIDSNATITVAAGRAHGRQGEMVIVPITISDPMAAVGAGATEITCTLRYNALMLDPTGSTPRGTADAMERSIPLSFPIPTNGDTLLANLPFTVALGDDSLTVLDIVNPATNRSTVTVLDSDGLFTLDSICREGGPRLLNPNSRVAIKLIGAQPLGASNGVDITIETMEAGRTRLQLIDPTGRIVRSLLDEPTVPEQMTLHGVLDNLSSGRYLLLLMTPTSGAVLPIEVAR